MEADSPLGLIQDEKACHVVWSSVGEVVVIIESFIEGTDVNSNRKDAKGEVMGKSCFLKVSAAFAMNVKYTYEPIRLSSGCSVLIPFVTRERIGNIIR